MLVGLFLLLYLGGGSPTRRACIDLGIDVYETDVKRADQFLTKLVQVTSQKKKLRLTVKISREISCQASDDSFFKPIIRIPKELLLADVNWNAI